MKRSRTILLVMRTGDSSSEEGLNPGGIVRQGVRTIGSRAGDIDLYLAPCNPAREDGPGCGFSTTPALSSRVPPSFPALEHSDRSSGIGGLPSAVPQLRSLETSPVFASISGSDRSAADSVLVESRKRSTTKRGNRSRRVRLGDLAGLVRVILVLDCMLPIKVVLQAAALLTCKLKWFFYWLKYHRHLFELRYGPSSFTRMGTRCWILQKYVRAPGWVHTEESMRCTWYANYYGAWLVIRIKLFLK